jgi:regulator of extracellular matrix RemA (YlzA/DUF370 family)
VHNVRNRLTEPEISVVASLIADAQDEVAQPQAVFGRVARAVVARVTGKQAGKAVANVAAAEAVARGVDVAFAKDNKKADVTHAPKEEKKEQNGGKNLPRTTLSGIRNQPHILELLRSQPSLLDLLHVREVLREQ